jgi:undecaprenyl pyrophosphate synthase
MGDMNSPLMARTAADSGPPPHVGAAMPAAAVRRLPVRQRWAGRAAAEQRAALSGRRPCELREQLRALQELGAMRMTLFFLSDEETHARTRCRAHSRRSSAAHRALRVAGHSPLASLVALRSRNFAR